MRYGYLDMLNRWAGWRYGDWMVGVGVTGMGHGAWGIWDISSSGTCAWC